MGEKIAIGFHTCLDYELVWSQETLEGLIEAYDIRAAEIMPQDPIETERAMVLHFLHYLRQGMGGEVVPTEPQICTDFAARFAYEKTIGGTATRAALAIEKIGHSSVVQMCCLNESMLKLLPPGIEYLSSVEVRKEDAPHVILQYPAGARIKAGDVDFVTPRENRVMCSHDVDSMNMELTEDFIPLVQDAEVFLLSCFSEMVDLGVLEQRMETVRRILKSLPEKTLVVLEDGHYVKEGFRKFVHRQLAACLTILSMNEDELQGYVGRKVDLMDPGAVLEAVREVGSQTGIPYTLVHSSGWAVLHGEAPGFAREALEAATALAATRYRKGDAFGREEYEETKRLPGKQESLAFCQALEKLGAGQICCVPGKDLSGVKDPTVVGLGDYFAGGLLPALTLQNRGQ